MAYLSYTFSLSRSYRPVVVPSVGWPGPVTFQIVRLFCRSYQVMVSGSAFQVRALE